MFSGGYCVFFFKQKTAYEMRISDWSSDVCSSDLVEQEIGLRMLEIIGGELTLTFKKDIAIADAFIVELEVVHPVHALDIHGQPFQPVGDLARHRRAIEPADLLEIGELRHLQIGRAHV